ncbi:MULTISPECIES: helix-turn-helix domain-containing protein [unclassified Coleofasciculus]|uniref:helix-turn-helix domain-containing protein n=1 Tax=unclassified Coleofasciculus TaxID=2692782 RepID=UPI00187E3ABE|nr:MULTISPECIES: RodZ domain-containing protein [unclassified Coleofasciculus]MBE9127355.1 helix-turn-helix domain-containing protein [Coleofasciculus sp. LEGE 07081]MBE9150661.1 helix-turn-helix domain-containing protein [Coleofasciculus sp. LEGE 07092]
MKENKSHLQQEQLEKLEELGARLRQRRNEKSIGIEEVAAKTRIQARLLKAIEEGKWDQLPEPIYIQGFIRRFAEALGLNGAEFASAFPTGSGLQYMKPCWRYLPGTQLRPIHLYVLYIGLVIGAVSGLSYLVSRSAIQVIEVENNPSHAQQFPVPETSQLVESQQPPESSQSAQVTHSSLDGKPVQVGVTLKSQSWLRIVADGKTEFEGVLPEGTQRTWVADDKLIVRAGNAGGVLVEFNNQSAKQMGAPGAVEELTFAANPRS